MFSFQQKHLIFIICIVELSRLKFGLTKKKLQKAENKSEKPDEI